MRVVQISGTGVVLLLSLCFHVATAQHVTITVANLNPGKATLSALNGEKSTMVDSVASKDSRTFSFTLHQRQPGIYRLGFDRAKWIDFINDGEDVEIVSDARALVDSIRIVRSESNRLYYEFRKLNQQHKTKSEILQLVLARYPDDDPYYRVTKEAAKELQNTYLAFVQSATSARPVSFVSRYIRSARLPVVDLTHPLEGQLANLKAHATDNVDFKDEGLVHSDLFTSKSIEYLMYYRNPQLPKELLAKEFNIAIDSLLNRAKVNQVVYKHLTEYLIEGFKQFGFEECINYILDNYVIKDDLCLEGSGNTIQRMIDQKKYLPVGAYVPEIILPDTSGRPVSLMSISSRKVLVVFYSTDCPHCRTMLPRLSQTTKGRRGLAVLAVSLDDNRNDWLGFIRTHALEWNNVIDVQGWGGKAAIGYHIYATPTMILLDKDKKLVGMPATVEEVERLL